LIRLIIHKTSFVLLEIKAKCEWLVEKAFRATPVVKPLRGSLEKVG
jgi:hypothetical protein